MTLAKRSTPYLLGAVAAALWLTAGQAQAGRRCDAAKPTVQTIERGLDLAQRTAEALEQAHRQNGMRVALLARAGQDLSRYQQYWSHVGWAYRTPEGVWRVVHKLNTCGTDQSIVTRQGLGEFFLDDLWRYEASWRPLPAHWQEAMWQLLQNNAQALTLHEPRYSMVSYAWGTRYQQSNQWAMETLALAAEPATRQRTQAQNWLQGQGYRPGTLRVGALTRLGGRIAAGNVAFDDHPNEERFADRIHTITADSVLAWLDHLPATAGAGQGQKVEGRKTP